MTTIILRSIIVLFAAGLMSCAPISSPPPVVGDVPVSSHAGPLELAMWQSPDIAALRFDYLSRLAAVDEVSSRRRSQVNGSVTAGANRNDVDGTQTGGQADVRLSRVLSDNGQTTAAENEARLQAEAAQTAYAMAANDWSVGVVQAVVRRDAAQRVIDIIDRRLADYNDRKPMLDQAASVGVLTTSNLLTIQQTLNDVETRRLSARLERDSAASELAMLVLYGPEGTANTASATVRRLSADITRSMPRWREAGLELAIKQSDARLRSILLSRGPVTSLTGVVATPSADQGDYDLRLGLRIDLPISDGGARDAQARSAAIAGRSTDAQLQALRDQMMLAQQAYDLQTLNARAQTALLQQRLEIANDRVAELEQLLAAGRADIEGLTRELLSLALTEVALVEADQRSKLALVSLANTYGGGCALLDVCDVLTLATSGGTQ